MSSSEQKKPFRAKRMMVALALGGLVAASGCTVRPLYSDAGYAGGTAGSVGAALSTIAIKPATTRVGQEVRNHLIFLFNGGKGQPANPTYSLTVFASAASEATTTIIVNDQNEPTSAIMTATGTYTLTDSSGKVVANGSRNYMSSYDVPRQEFAALRAARDAENRASRELAELIRMAIAQDLAKAGKS